MIQLEEHLKKGHDIHVVARITKKIGEWSFRETAGENAALAQTILEEKAEGNRRLCVEGNPGLGSPRELTGEENRGFFPSGSERPELDLSDVGILDAQTNGGKPEEIKK